MYHWSFRKKVRLIWWLLVTLVLTSVPYTLWEFKEHNYSLKFIGWTTSGIFVLLTIPVTVYQIALHVAHYNAPERQRHVVRIILMVPIYAMVSWFSLRWSSCRRWLSPARECYEAVVLYSFYRYLIESLKYETRQVEGQDNYNAWMNNLPPQHPLPPLTGKIGEFFHVRTIDNGVHFMHAMRRGVLAYVFVRPALAAIQLACMFIDANGWGEDTWGEGKFQLNKWWLWCQLTNNVTQFLSIYCLVALYHATHKELESIQPLRKFILIKMVVFFTFWQGFLLSILNQFGLIGKEQWTVYDNKQLASGIQDVIICMECLPAALMFAVAFPAKDYARPGEDQRTVLQNIVDMFDVRDLGRDVGELVEEEATQAHIQVVGVAYGAARTVSTAAQEAAMYPVRAATMTVNGITRDSFWRVSADAPSSVRENGHAMTPLLSSVDSKVLDEA